MNIRLRLLLLHERPCHAGHSFRSLAFLDCARDAPDIWEDISWSHGTDRFYYIIQRLRLKISDGVFE